MALLAKLKDACLKNDIDKIRMFGDDSPVWSDVNNAYGYQFHGVGDLPHAQQVKKSLFHVATFLCKHQIFEHFLKHGAKTDVKSGAGDLPIHYACASQVDAAAKVKTLFSLDKECFLAKNNEGRTPICFAFRYGPYSVLRALVETTGSNDVIKNDVDASLLLHYACESDADAQAKVTSLLSTQPQHVNSQNCSGKTALSIACKNLNVKTVMFLIENGADASMEDNYGIIPIHEASWNRHHGVEVVEALLNIDSSFVNSVDNEDRTPVCYAASDTPVNADMVKLLLARGADTKVKGKRQPLHVACSRASPEVVQMLVDSGADVNARASDGNGVLEYCFRHNENPMENARIVLKAGADVNSLDARGDTPLHEVVRNNAYLAALLLLNHGADASMQNKKSQTVLDLLAIPESSGTKDCDVHSKLYHRLLQGSSCSTEKRVQHFFNATKSMDSELLSEFLLQATDVNQTGSDGETALHVASESGPNSAANTNVLLLWDANGNLQDCQGDTALHRAARQGNVDTVALLTSHVNTDVELKNREGQKAVNVAQVEEIKVMIDEAAAETPQHTGRLARRLADEVKYLKDELNHTRAQTCSGATQPNSDNRQSQKLDQIPDVEVRTLEEAETNVPKLESNILNLMSRMEQLEARDKDKSVLNRKLKAEILQLHNENQALINQVHRFRVKQKRRDMHASYKDSQPSINEAQEVQVKQKRHGNRTDNDNDVIYEAFIKCASEMLDQRACEPHLTVLRDKHLLSEDDVTRITSQEPDKRMRKMVPILLGKDNKSWTPVFLDCMRQSPGWCDVTKQVDALCTSMAMDEYTPPRVQPSRNARKSGACAIS